MTSSSTPVPNDLNDADNRRLWVGNLDPRLSEYSLLKIFQRFGELEKFDFLLHKGGPDAGKPRGYCFISYKSRKDAERALIGLHGKQACRNILNVRWANDEPQGKDGSKEVRKELPKPCSHLSTEGKIKAIEEQLKKMQESEPDFSATSKLMAPPGSSALSAINKQNNPQKPPSKYSHKPYTKHKTFNVR